MKKRVKKRSIKRFKKSVGYKKNSLLVGFLFYSNPKTREATDIAYRKAFRNSHPNKNYYRLINYIFYTFSFRVIIIYYHLFSLLL